MTQVILVDKNNRKIGEMEKLEAHQKGLLHRAFSVFIFNSGKELLLQKRNSSKYHSGGLWTNTVCSHPMPGESYLQAVHRRLQEEMGFDCPVKKIGNFIYKAEFDDGLIEHEYDCVYTGIYNGIPLPNQEEIEDIRWMNIKNIQSDIALNPNIYTYWFKKILGDKNLVQLFNNTTYAK